jgi:hypothetical protein
MESKPRDRKDELGKSKRVVRRVLLRPGRSAPGGKLPRQMLMSTIDPLQEEWLRGIESTGDSLRSEFAEAVRQLRVERLDARRVGIVLLLLGVIVGAIGNLL